MPIKNYRLISFPIAIIIIALSLSTVYAVTDTAGTGDDADTTTTTTTTTTGQMNPRKQINQETKSAVQEANKTRQMKIKELKDARKAKFEELKTTRKAESTVRKEMVKENFSQAQLTNLEKIKSKMSLNEARFSKSVEHLYFVTDKLDSHLQEQKDAGFDVADKEKQLDAIQVKIAALEKQVDDLSVMYKDLEGLEGEEIRAKLPEIKAQIAAIVTTYKDIKTDLVAMMKGLR